MFRYIICILLFFLLLLQSKAQEGYAVYNSYLFDNYYSIHPSIAGLAYCSKLRVFSKQQWVGSANDTPIVFSLSYQGKIKPQVGIGALIFQDKNGPTTQTGINLSYSYHLKLAENSSQVSFRNNSLMAFSLTYQGFYKNIGTSKLVGGEPNDPVLSSPSNRFYHNVNFSYTFIFNYFFASFTANSLIPYKNDFKNEIYNIENYRNYFITAGFSYYLTNHVSIEPSATLFYFEKLPKKHIDINAKLYYDLEFFNPFATLGYRAILDEGFNSNLLSIIFGAKYRNLTFGYSFDIEIGDIRRYYAPSHKFMLGVNLFCGTTAGKRNSGCKYFVLRFFFTFFFLAFDILFP